MTTCGSPCVPASQIVSAKHLLCGLYLGHVQKFRETNIRLVQYTKRLTFPIKHAVNMPLNDVVCRTNTLVLNAFHKANTQQFYNSLFKVTSPKSNTLINHEGTCVHKALGCLHVLMWIYECIYCRDKVSS